MSELSTLARPYAEAVYKRAIESESTATWSDMLVFLVTVMEDKEIAAVIVNPKVGQKQLTALLLEICQDNLTLEGSNLLKLLIQNDRVVLVPQIAALYESFKAEHEGYVEVELISAFALTKEEQKKFTTTLKNKLNKEVHMTTSIDKSLVGGFLAKAGDTVIDGSIKGRLHQLTKIL